MVRLAAFASGPAGPPGADLVVLENFDDNLSQVSGRWTVRDQDLAALLGTWTGKLLITCRRPFVLAEQPGAVRLVFRHLGPLTRSGAAELITALPAISLLGEDERDQVYRLTAGHPMAMEYVDRLLARGEPSPELASRLEAAITTALRTVPDKAGNLPGPALPRTEPTELPEAAAELIAATAGQLMFGELFGRPWPRWPRPAAPRAGCSPSSVPSARRTSLGTPAQRGRW